MGEESSSKLQSCSSYNMENTELSNPKLLHFGSNNPCTESQLQTHFPQIPQDLPFSPESQELLARFEDPYLFKVFGPADAHPELCNEAQFPVGKSGTGCMSVLEEENDKPVNPDAFFDDFPTDMFDNIEPLPSPPDW